MHINGVKLNSLHRKRVREAMLAEREFWRHLVNIATTDESCASYREEVARCDELLKAIDTEAS